VRICTLLAAGFALVALFASGCGGYAGPDEGTTSTPSSGSTTSADDGY